MSLNNLGVRSSSARPNRQCRPFHVEHGRVVVANDDAHISIYFFHYLINRVREKSVKLVCPARTYGN